MKFNLRTPCNNCPFRSDHPIQLMPGRVEGIADSILKKDQAFPCHKRTGYINGRRVMKKNHSMCAGALIFQAKNGGWNLSTRLAIMLGWFIPNQLKLNMKAPVCSTVAELTAAQVRAQNA